MLAPGTVRHRLVSEVVGLPGQHLSDDEVLQVVSYVMSKHDSHPANPKPRDPERDARCSPDGKGDRDDNHNDAH